MITAQQVGRYKPDTAASSLAHERIERELGVPQERVLHVAQSLFHDHVPAKSLGMTTVWIDRRDGRAGGATPRPRTRLPTRASRACASSPRTSSPRAEWSYEQAAAAARRSPP